MVSRIALDRLERNALAQRARANGSTRAEDRPGNIIEFASDERFLGLRLYPRQATLLKVMTCRPDLLSGYDREVLREWTDGFTAGGPEDEPRWVGSQGTTPDIYERMEWCRANGRRWFAEVLAVIGRRGSKNFCAAIFAAWVAWEYLHDAELSGRAGAKRMSIPVFAGNQSQAILNQYGDIVELIETAECFKPYLAARPTADCLELYSAAQVERPKSKRGRPLLEFRARATATNAARGPATPMLMLDEIAHVAGAGSTADSCELYDAAFPAVAQFDEFSAIVQTSSPWDREGQLFRSYQRACRIDVTTGDAAEPDKIVVQLPSWALYEDWERASSLDMWTDGPRFAQVDAPPVAYDETLQRHEHANPDSFAVEFRAQWRVNLLAYLPPSFVDGIFSPYRAEYLQQQTHGVHATAYVAHGDPSKSQKNFGFAIAHLDHDDNTVAHVVFDVIKFWSPKDFGGVINYRQVESEILDYLRRFNVTHLSFDQFNSLSSIENLQAAVDAISPGRTQVYEQTATAKHNHEACEVFKTAAGHGIIHAPHHDLARAELEALKLVNGKVVHPTSGPTQTKDIFDAMSNVVYTLLRDSYGAVFAHLASLTVSGSVGGGMTPRFRSSDDQVHDALRSAHGPVRGSWAEQPIRRGGSKGRARR